MINSRQKNGKVWEPRFFKHTAFKRGDGEISSCYNRKQYRIWVWVMGSLVYTQRCDSVFEAQKLITQIYQHHVLKLDKEEAA